MTDLQSLQAQLGAAQASLDQAVLAFWRSVVFGVALALGVVLHELGHAVMAWRAGMPVRVLRLGTGPALLRWRFGSAWLVVRAIPFSGGVLALVPHPPPGLKAAAGFLAGGMGANALGGAAAALAWLRCPDSGWWLIPVAAAQATLIVGAAMPFTWWHRRGYQSDGERLRRLWREGSLWSPTEAQLDLAQRLELTEPVPAPSPAWPEIAYQVTRPERVGETWARRDACTVLRTLSDGPDLTWFERLLVRDELILQEATDGEGVLTPAELDAWSAAALEAAPTGPIQVARAGALCRLERWDEAEALLEVDTAGTRAVYRRLFLGRIRLSRAGTARLAARAPGRP